MQAASNSATSMRQYFYAFHSPSLTSSVLVLEYNSNSYWGLKTTLL